METRSRVDLRACGVHVYAEDSSTEIFCIAFKLGDEDTKLFLPYKLSLEIAGISGQYRIIVRHEPLISLQEAIKTATTIEAHNMSFEATLWHHVMHKRYGYPDLPKEKLRCSAAKASTFALPRDLKRACLALGVPQQKDQTGYRIMMKMCKPRKPTKNNASEWHENPDEFKILCEYCIQDVEAEHSLSNALYDISDKELEVFQLDMKINDRGVKVDISSIENIIEKVKAKETSLLLETQQITHGALKSPRQIAQTLLWLQTKGVHTLDLKKDTVEKLLKTELDPKARRVLEIRQSLSKSSVSKLTAMKKRASKGDRVRGTLMYHGANTGRWAGKGIQPQNLPRDSFDEKHINNFLTSDNDLTDMLYDCTLVAASKSIRGMITCDKGNELLCADFSAIEARVLAWLAGEKSVLKAFENGLDLYKIAATDIYHVKYEAVTKEQRAVGKVCILALGYQGWLGAFQAMAEGYGVEVPEDDAKEIIMNWRQANGNIVKMWNGLYDTAKKAILTGEPHSYGNIKYGLRNSFLHCRLPSGRLLAYYKPRITKAKVTYYEMITTVIAGVEHKKKVSRTVEKEVIAYMGIDSLTNKWTELNTYGGKLTENVTQAVARDILSEALLRLDNARVNVVLHVHDEIIAEEKKGSPLHIFEEIMAESPEWLKGCPMVVEGWKGKRYRK